MARHVAVTAARHPRLAAWALAGVALAGCSSTVGPSTEPEIAASLTASRSATPAATPAPTARPTPTPPPTPRFTNPADPELAALFPSSVGGIPVVVPSPTEFALTPGDVGLVYGELGVRFASLALAYTDVPRTAVYAVRVDGPPVSTRELEPYLAEAGRYVGIAGLHREPWELTEAGGHQVWMRGEDAATPAGTRIYTWASGDHVFLLIGTDDAVNRALIAALPGEPPEPAGTDSAAASATLRPSPDDG